jgi:hypothetical protein
VNKVRYLLFINAAQCRIREQNYRKAQHYLDEAASLDLTDVEKVKAYYR